MNGDEMNGTNGNFGCEFVLTEGDDEYPHIWMRIVDVESKFIGLSFTHQHDPIRMRRISVEVKEKEKLVALRDFFVSAAESIDAFIGRNKEIKT